MSDKGAPFVVRFWEQLQESLGTHVIRSSAYHPQTDGQTERVNQILEDMLRACVLLVRIGISAFLWRSSLITTATSPA
jgi:uncharacterized protein involved in tolerance to divalent cations